MGKKTKLRISSIMRQLTLSVMPKKGVGHRYLRRGLLCRMVKPGIYRIYREDGGGTVSVLLLVEFSSPWKDQTVPGFKMICGTRGEGCYSLHADCVGKRAPVRVPKWSAVCRVVDPRYFEVCVLRTLPRRNSSKTETWVPSAGAGFYVMHLSMADG